MRNIWLLIMLVLSFILFSCSTGSVIITGTVRPAIDPNEVKIYLTAPLQYETIGIVEASSDVEVSRQSAQDRVIDELKKQAAKIGANGVLLINTGERTSGGTFIGGVFVTGQTLTGRGEAIYVIQE